VSQQGRKLKQNVQLHTYSAAAINIYTRVKAGKQYSFTIIYMVDWFGGRT